MKGGTMPREKIDYGIDLGTTNSEIARVDNGEITIFRHEPHKKVILPSCVYFTKRKQMFVGDKAYEALSISRETIENTFAEFKRTMGEDATYRSEHTGKSYTSEELSAEVLKKLKRAVKDEEFSSAVITVPAAFKQVQIEATRRAAEMAGFEYFELLQEPIAASLAFLKDQKNIDGIWLVFDLGGGTFDAALVKMEDGIMTVVDHAGDNHLGGKNMDWLLVNEIIIPYLRENFSIEAILNDNHCHEDLCLAWKCYAEEAKIALSEETSYFIAPEEPICEDDNGNKIDTAISFNRSELENLISPLLDRAVNICKELLIRNKLSSSDLMTVLMIGGPTYIPLLRKKVKNELCKNINVTIDPMTAVAQGAAIFASTKPNPVEKQKRDYSKIQLILGYPDTTVETEIALGIRVDKEKTSGTVPPKVFVEITRNDTSWTSGRIELEGGAAIVRLPLIENSTNGFSIQLIDETENKLECEPNSISILQGIKIAQPPLPLDIGISATVTAEEYEELMVPILTKGTSLPAVSLPKTFFVPKNLRPGNSSDVLKIIVWNGEGGTRPIRNEPMGEIIISGDKLASLLPEGSKVEVTIRMDDSRRTTVSAYLTYLDETIEKVMNPDYKLSAIITDELARQIEIEKDRLSSLADKLYNMEEFDDVDDFERIGNDLEELDEMKEKGLGNKDRNREILDRLKETAAKIDEFERSMKWPQVENELTEELEATEQVVDKYGNDRDEQILSQLRSGVEKAIELKNVRLAKDIKDKLLTLKYRILFKEPGYWVSVLNNINEQFDEIQWSSRSKARSLVDKGSSLLASSQFSDEIKNIVQELWELMPDTDKEKMKAPRTDIPIYGHKL